MNVVALRPTEPGDLAKVWDQPLQHRLRGITMTIDGAVAAVGGLVFYPDGNVWIGAFVTPQARRAAVTLHRAGMRIMRDAELLGLCQLYASVARGESRSEAWVSHFGFRPTDFTDAGRRVWVWNWGDTR